jgi:APA family basic amino acid/polyamine antiporter
MMPENDITQEGTPKAKLNLTDAIAIIVGIVVGAGIFRTPSLVAANTSTDLMFLLTWVLGGLVSLIGALCYAELTTAFPNTGGDYHFIRKAYGKNPAFLFAWARMSIVQTGSIALLAFIFGDYMSQLYPLGSYSTILYAALMVVFLTVINILGIGFGTGTQKLFTLAEVGGVILIVVAGLFFAPDSAGVTAADQSALTTENQLGLAMVFVLLTFGGWNEAAYLSGEIKSGRGQMVKALVFSILIITGIYLLINYAYLKVLGHAAMAQSDAVGADVMHFAWGDTGVWTIGLLVAISALTSANATIFTGARTNYALGKDFKVFSFLGHWNQKASGPVNAFLVQGAISLGLIGLGLITRSGFESIVEYTAPVFWFFFLLVGIAVFILRKKFPDVKRPFKVPFYPIMPLLFCVSSAYLLYSSVNYTGLGALVGIAVLGLGLLLLIGIRATERAKSANKEKASLLTDYK